MDLDFWSELCPSIRKVAEDEPQHLPELWDRMSLLAGPTLTEGDQVLMTALKDIGTTSSVRLVAALDALVRWALVAPRPASTRELHRRVKLLQATRDAEAQADGEALDGLLAAIIRQTAPPGLLDALRISSGLASARGGKVGEA